MKTVQRIKHEQREKLLLRELASLLQMRATEDPLIGKASLTRVTLSPDRSSCALFFYMPEGAAAFDPILEQLKLYKPSMRAALAKTLTGRGVPELSFRFDDQFEKQSRLHSIMDSLKAKGEI
jgi:ribosome-binding factor A